MTRHRQTLSVCIIAKNEEAYIENSLKSILPVADEIIFVDTGSTDNTVAIAKKYTDKIYFTEWENDFSKARNEYLKYATCDWILSIDADEVLTKESQVQILNFLLMDKFKDEPIVFNFKILEETEIKDKYKIFYKRALFKNKLGFKFLRAIHEDLYIDNVEVKRVNAAMFCFYHKEKRLSKLEMEKKMKYYIEIMLNELKKDLNNKDLTDYNKHLGTSFETLGDNDKALEYYLESYKYYSKAYSSKQDLFYENLLVKIIKLFILTKHDYKTALTYANEFLQISTSLENTVNAYYYMGHCKQNLEDFEYAILDYQKALSILLNKKDIPNLKNMESCLNYEIEKCKSKLITKN